MEKKRIITAFDFDGTLTTSDTLVLFIRYVFGYRVCCMGFLLHLPFIVLMLLHCYPNGKCKQRLFSWFFRGMSYDRFRQLGIDFEREVRPLLRPATIALLQQHRQEGPVYVVSASIDEWVRPVCQRLGVSDVLCTQVEVDEEGCLTGRFLMPNCYGEEKVRRLLEVEPMREDYFLYAYGDSKGDRALLAFADKGTRV